MSAATPAVSPAARKLAGWTLIIAAVLSVAAMSHHPVAHGSDPAAVMRAMLATATLNAWVHGSLIALMLAVAWALIEFSALRGFARATVRAALWLYVVGVAAMLVAALTSGFVSTRIAARFVDGDAAALLQGQTLLAFGWAVNQVAANFSVVVMSCAIALWSVDLARDRGVTRALGIGGLVVALACLASLALGMRLDLHGMLMIVVGLTVWQVAVGVWMLRGAT